MACSTAVRLVAASCWPRVNAAVNAAAVFGYVDAQALVVTYPAIGKSWAAPWSISKTGTTPCPISAADKNGSVMNAASTRCAASAAPIDGNGTTTKCTDERGTP